MLRTGQLLAPHKRDFVAPLRRRPLDRRREPCYRGPWRLPGPDSHRLADESLRSVIPSQPPNLGRPELQDALPLPCQIEWHGGVFAGHERSVQKPADVVFLVKSLVGDSSTMISHTSV
jgi:hypothetical protein